MAHGDERGLAESPGAAEGDVVVLLKNLKKMGLVAVEPALISPQREVLSAIAQVPNSIIRFPPRGGKKEAGVAGRDSN